MIFCCHPEHSLPVLTTQDMDASTFSGKATFNDRRLRIYTIAVLSLESIVGDGSAREGHTEWEVSLCSFNAELRAYVMPTLGVLHWRMEAAGQARVSESQPRRSSTADHARPPLVASENAWLPLP